jgi:HD superfamily phosphodiesterase
MNKLLYGYFTGRSMMIERVFLEMMRFYSGDPQKIQHFTKVHGYARLIGLGEGIPADTLETLEIAAIVHDIGIKPAMEKFGSDAGNLQEVEGPPLAEAMLAGLGCPRSVIDRVCYLVSRHHTYDNVDGIDYQILIEADFLVNMFEGSMGRDAIATTLEKIFRTGTGREYCRIMFGAVR